MDLEIWKNLQWEVQQTWEALKCSQTTLPELTELTELTEPTDSTSSEEFRNINIKEFRKKFGTTSTDIDNFNIKFQQCFNNIDTSTHRLVESPAPGSWNSRSHAGDVWRRRGPWHVPCGVPCSDRLAIDGLWSCNSRVTGSSGSSGSFVSACVLSQSWRPFRCHSQRCKDIWKRWRSQTSHDFGLLRHQCDRFNLSNPLDCLDSLVPPWAIPMFLTSFQSLQSSCFFWPSSPFNILRCFSTFSNKFSKMFQACWVKGVVLPPFLQSAVQELRAELQTLQTLEQGVGSNDGEADLDGSGWIWAKDWLLPLHIAALGIISWCIYESFMYIIYIYYTCIYVEL